MSTRTHILVTGGAGFIGSHLCEALLRAGDRVTALDDLSTGARQNLARIRDPLFTFVEGDAKDKALVDELIASCDAVVHLAAAVGVRMVIERPVHAITNNLRASETVFRAAARHRRRLLFASSSEVYGKGKTPPFSEDADLCLGPTSCARWSYGAAKAMDEWLAFALAEESGLKAIGLRFFNTVGPRQSGRYGMVLPNFVARALMGQPIRIHGTGEQTRAFAPVSAIVQAIVELLPLDRAYGQAINLGGSEEISILELAHRIRAHLQSSSEIVLVPYEEAFGPGFEDLPRRVPDLRRLDALLGWTPQTDWPVLIDAVRESLLASSAFCPTVRPAAAKD